LARKQKIHKRIYGKVFGRVGVSLVLIILQLALFFQLIHRFQTFSPYFLSFSMLLSFAAVLFLINNRSKPGAKIAWIILVMAFPLIGGIVYFWMSLHPLNKQLIRGMAPMQKQLENYLPQDKEVFGQLKAVSIKAANQSAYIQKYAHCPVYTRSTSEYFDVGEKKFRRLLEELSKAKHYIFLEYFIIGEGEMWQSILGILKEKAKAGLDVRIIYDDIGSLLNLPDGYPKYLESLGIKCSVFNPVTARLHIKMNTRNHRKILIIDGHVAFNGGINIGDEYINRTKVLGHWKDTALLIKGEAVWSFTVMFLTMWESLRKTGEDVSSFRPHVYHEAQFEGDGFIQPFTDSPLDEEHVGENVYLNLINQAQRYIYITSPYLILDYELQGALGLAAKRGVDVRILTPHIGDKHFVHTLTRANYRNLLLDGVRIYEYTPGFVHSKMFVVDDELAVIGTINLDYRSLYLHFECATWLYGTKTVGQMQDDMMRSLDASHEITQEQYRNTPFFEKLLFNFLRLFAPIM